MSDDPPEPVPAPPPPSGAVLPALEDLSRKLDTVAGAVATIAAGHSDLLGHVAEAEARRGHDAMDLAARLAAIERQLLASPEDEGDRRDDVEAVLERLASIERAVGALPGAAPGVESTFVALADRLDALADGEREGRAQLAELVTAVDELRAVRSSAPADDDAPRADPAIDLRAELQALTDAQRAVADELAALGPRVNELLDRHPDGLPVPPPPAPEIVVPDEVTPPPSTEIDLAPLQEQVAELAAVTTSQGDDLGLALEVLSKVAEAIDRLDARTDDRLAAIRDASITPMVDLQALLAARGDRTDTQMQELTELVAAAVESLATAAPPPEVVDTGEPFDHRDDAPPPGPDPVVLDRLEDITQAVQSLTWQLPELVDAVVALRSDEDDGDEDDDRTSGADLQPATGPSSALADPLLEARLTHHIDTALAGVLRLFDDRLVALRAALTSTPMSTAPAPPAPAAMGGFEAGAVMGAAQAAWNRLEQRIDSEFDDLSRQLQALATLVEQAVATTESIANRPVVTGDQFKRAAVSLRDTVANANRQRRERRGGPKGLGPGGSSSGY